MYKMATESEKSDFIPQAQETYLELIDRYPDTLEAKKEARRGGVPLIELVDGDILVDMFEKLELGLIPKRDFDIDEKFFEEYKK